MRNYYEYCKILARQSLYMVISSVHYVSRSRARLESYLEISILQAPRVKPEPLLIMPLSWPTYKFQFDAFQKATLAEPLKDSLEDCCRVLCQRNILPVLIRSVRKLHSYVNAELLSFFLYTLNRNKTAYETGIILTSLAKTILVFFITKETLLC